MEYLLGLHPWDLRRLTVPQLLKRREWVKRYIADRQKQQ